MYVGVRLVYFCCCFEVRRVDDSPQIGMFLICTHRIWYLYDQGVFFPRDWWARGGGGGGGRGGGGGGGGGVGKVGKAQEFGLCIVRLYSTVDCYIWIRDWDSSSPRDSPFNLPTLFPHLAHEAPNRCTSVKVFHIGELRFLSRFGNT